MAFEFQSWGCMALNDDYIFIICGENGAAKYDLVRATILSDADGSFPIVAEVSTDGNSWQPSELFSRGKIPAGTAWYPKKKDMAYIRIPPNVVRVRLRAAANFAIPVFAALDGGPDKVYRTWTDSGRWNMGASMTPPPPPPPTPPPPPPDEEGWNN